jgi:hypothetical protein
MNDNAHISNMEPDPAHQEAETRPQPGRTVWQWIARVVVVILGIAVGCVLAVIIALFTDLIHLTC